MVPESEVGATILCNISQPLLKALDVLDRKPKSKKFFESSHFLLDYYLLEYLLVSLQRLRNHQRKQQKSWRPERRKKMQFKGSCRGFRRVNKETRKTDYFHSFIPWERCHLSISKLETFRSSWSKEAALHKDKSCLGVIDI